MQFIRRFQIPFYLILVLIISWIPWMTGNGTTLTMTPSLLALIFAFAINGRSAGMDLLKRALRWRTSLSWWLFALFGVAILYLLSIGVYVLLGYSAPNWLSLREDPALAALFFLIILLPIYGPVGEEIGWRGYLQEHLQSRFGPLWASVAIGAYWGIWHLPDFLVDGNVLQTLGIIFFIPYILGTIANSFIMTWIYNSTGKSTLLAGIIWHAAIDYFGFLLLADGYSLRAAQEAETAIVPVVAPTLYAITLIGFVAVALIIGWRTNWQFGFLQE